MVLLLNNGSNNKHEDKVKYFIIIIVITPILHFYGCKDNSIMNPDNTYHSGSRLVNVQVDLMYGFSGKAVVIEANKKRLYFAVLSETQLISGPEATFVTFLPAGENNITVYTQDYNNPKEQFMDSARINFKEKEKYFIGLQIVDTLQYFVQDSTFCYQ